MTVYDAPTSHALERTGAPDPVRARHPRADDRDPARIAGVQAADDEEQERALGDGPEIQRIRLVGGRDDLDPGSPPLAIGCAVHVNSSCASSP